MSDEKKWGAFPVNENEIEETEKIGAERIIFKMPVEGKDEMIEVNLLQVINQFFIELGQFHERLSNIEDLLEEAFEASKSDIILPSGVEIKI